MRNFVGQFNVLHVCVDMRCDWDGKKLGIVLFVHYYLGFAVQRMMRMWRVLGHWMV